jgi:putative ABC transport system ATP-binding protein
MIRLRGLERTFQLGGEAVYALRPLDLHIPAGAYLSIMGPSGSGKSTLLHLLGLLDRPDRGEYRLDGIDTATLDEEGRARLRRERIGFVFQSFHLIPRLTAAENVELPLTLAGLPPAERRPRVAQALASFGLGERAGHRPDQLSGGQRQRVAIARATILRPACCWRTSPPATWTGIPDRR